MTKDETDYQDGMTAGIAEAEAEEGDLMTTRVRNARYVASQEAAR